MRLGLVLAILTSLLLAACGPASAPTAQKPQPQAAGATAGPARLTIIYRAQPIEGMSP